MAETLAQHPEPGVSAPNSEQIQAQSTTDAVAGAVTGAAVLTGISQSIQKALPVSAIKIPYTNLLDGVPAIWEEDWTGGWKDRWEFTSGGGGFGNGELQVYTTNEGNVFSPNSGFLNINAIVNKGKFSSAKLTSRRTMGITSFYLEIPLPRGAPWVSGIWPAVWMLPQNGKGYNWPRGGEVDIFEIFGPNQWTDYPVMSMTPHWATHDVQWGHSKTDHYLDPTRPLILGVCVSGFSITWYLDRVPVKSLTVPALGKGQDGSGFASLADFVLILNVAIGGNATQYQTPPNGWYPFTIGTVRQWATPPGGWGVFGAHQAKWQSEPKVV